MKIQILGESLQKNRTFYFKYFCTTKQILLQFEVGNLDSRLLKLAQDMVLVQCRYFDVVHSCESELFPNIMGTLFSY